MHEYSVAFTIAGDEVEESEISGMLGLKPSLFRKKGEPRSPKSRNPTSVWSLQFEPPDGKHSWESLERGLEALIETLQPVKEKLQELRKRFPLDAYCGHFGSGFGGGPTISPETLGALAQLGLSMALDTYYSGTEPE